MFSYFRGAGCPGDMYVFLFSRGRLAGDMYVFIFAGPAEGETCMFFIFAEGRDMYVFFDEQAKDCQFASFYKGSWRQISQKRKILTCRPQEPRIRLSGRPRGHVCFFIFASRPAGDMYVFYFRGDSQRGDM